MLIPHPPPPHEIHSSACSYLLMMTQKLRKERCHTAGNPKRWLNSAYLRKSYYRPDGRKWAKESELRATMRCLPFPCPCRRPEEHSIESTELEARSSSIQGQQQTPSSAACTSCAESSKSVVVESPHPDPIIAETSCRWIQIQASPP